MLLPKRSKRRKKWNEAGDNAVNIIESYNYFSRSLFITALMQRFEQASNMFMQNCSTLIVQWASGKAENYWSSNEVFRLIDKIDSLRRDQKRFHCPRRTHNLRPILRLSANWNNSHSAFAVEGWVVINDDCFTSLKQVVWWKKSLLNLHTLFHESWRCKHENILRRASRTTPTVINAIRCKNQPTFCRSELCHNLQ